MGLSDSQNSIKGWVKTGSTERNFLLDRARKNFATGPRLAGAPVQGRRTGHGTAPGYGKTAGRIERDLTQIGERPLSPRQEAPINTRDRDSVTIAALNRLLALGRPISVRIAS